MDKYLLEILKEVNTIIIPGLGALTITNPDTGEIMFMSYLKHDDGKLAAYIVNKEGIDENEAKNQIAKYVRQIQTELDKGESYDMFEFGSFYKKNDEIDFRNWEGSGGKVKVTDKVAVKKEDKKDTKTTVPAKEIEKPSKEPEKKIENASTSSVTGVKKEDPKNASTSSATEAQKESPEQKKAESTKEVEDKTAKKIPEVKETPKKIVPEVKAAEKTVQSTLKEEEKKKEAPVTTAPSSKDKKELNILQKEEKAATAAKMNKLKEKKKKENSQKKKRGIGFWMLIGLIVIIIAGGTFVGLNYEMVKQHIPFLADKSAKKEKAEKKSPKDKMIEILDKGEKEDEEAENETAEQNSEDQLPMNEVTESAVEENVIETKPIVSQNNSSTDLPFRIIAGAFSSEDNANRLADKYREKGYATNVSSGRGMFLVSIKSYSSRSEAQNGLNEVMADAPKAWIYEAQ